MSGLADQPALATDGTGHAVTASRVPDDELYAIAVTLLRAQDHLLIAIRDGRPLPDVDLRRLPPWRAVLIARIADRAGVPLEHGTVAQLVDEATAVRGAGTLAPTFAEWAAGQADLQGGG